MKGQARRCDWVNSNGLAPGPVPTRGAESTVLQFVEGLPASVRDIGTSPLNPDPSIGYHRRPYHPVS
jgi:hypothetical protein